MSDAGPVGTIREPCTGPLDGAKPHPKNKPSPRPLWQPSFLIFFSFYFTMSFGWSVGDILSGLKVVWDVYQAVSDGPLNAKFEATQFFDEFTLIVSRLSEWEKRKSALPQDDRLAQSHEQLRELCTVFIRRHMLLIQHANPQTKAIRPRRSNWLQKVEFTKIQVITLYELVKWPAERDEVQRLREKLMLFLHLAAFDIQMATHGMVSEIRYEPFLYCIKKVF